jgi:transcriptional regulator with XRE-family HTH domain
MVRKFVSPEDIVEIGERLRLLRLALGLSQSEIARRIGAKPSQWNNYEKPLVRIRIDEAIKLSQTFGVPLDWVYQGDARMMPYELKRRIDDMREPPKASRSA